MLRLSHTWAQVSDSSSSSSGVSEAEERSGGAAVTWKPPSVMVTDTSSGRLTTPATDLMSDMKSSGNQTMQMSSRTIRPPIPYFTTRFFFCPRGCGYL